MANFKLKCRNLYEKCFVGEKVLDKSTLWLVCAVVFMAGLVYGLLIAPLTHGVTISCGNNNGSNNSNNRGCGVGELDDED